ncbi:beta-N-acetylglucosaminidase domain-containing protein [Microbacterium sp.]|uniref:beta-N-acetylglucosaminidase domain-containing protein n=1 Tax=Microbacterium sp. TaxID=51671 RepID=UPI00273522E9|nr:beta-N-acetylglucosaminidase domain-containing protein [Microbacterium sp.]MDP3952671.1 beta-N-acetylglucosaminidase domain-containing protein [Microbacterium sp.]
MRDDDTELLERPLIPQPQRCELRGGGRPLTEVISDIVEVRQAGLVPEGYRLAVHEGHATVHASDPRGFRYARVTLNELAQLHAGRVPDVSIDDAPVLARRGIIEGFYGEPWSHAERLSALRLAGRLKLNSYVYAPKDDPFHRERWRESYPEEDLARLVELAGEGAKHGVDVVVALHPAGSMVFADDAEHELLAVKARQLLDAGIPDVALLFDDVPPTPVHDRDRERFGEDGAALGAAHALTVRRFREAVGSRLSGGELLVVPMDYAGTGASDYRIAFAAGLPERVLVWWTGSDIVVGEITRQDIDAAAEVFGDRLLLWDNFPVNDFDRGRAFLGPLSGRTADVAGSALRGAWSNPMVEYAPGGFGIAAFADWAWNPTGYVASRSARAALRVVAGAQAEELAPLVRTLSSWPPSAPMDQSLTDTADGALESAPHAAELRSRLEEWQALAGIDTAAEPARSLKPWLHAAVDMAAAGLAALDVHEVRPGATMADAETALARAEAHKAKVGADAIPAFARSVLERART